MAALALGLVLSPQGAARADGTTALWGNATGNNASGQLGDGTTTDRSTPGLIVDSNNVLVGKTVTQINAGTAASCALTSDGGAYCWGANGSGQLGDGTQTSRLTPVAVSTSGVLAGKAVTQISGGGGNGYTCAVTSDGGAYCWGDNAAGTLGDGTAVLRRLMPTAVSLPAGVTVKQVSVPPSPGGYACAVTSDGRAYCWGDNRFGQLGDGTGGTSILNPNTPLDPRPTPLAVDLSQLPPGVVVTQISAGPFHACAMTSDGGVYCWGDNRSGQMGNGTASSTTATRPVAVDRSGALSGKTVVQIAAGLNHACALTADGAVYCWGGNFGSTVPVSADSTGVLTGKTVVQISSSGVSGVCGVTSDGAGYCWNAATPAPIDTSGVLSGKFLRQISAASSASRRFPLAEHFAVVAPACGQGIDITSGPKALWHAFSLPANAGEPIVTDALGSGSAMNLDTSQYGVANPAAGTGWVLYRRLGSGRYIKILATDRLVPQVGYFIKTFQKPRLGKLLVDCADTVPSTNVTQAEGCSSANGCVSVNVNVPGAVGTLRFLGNPFPWPIDWSKVRVRVNGSAATYTPSQAAGLAASGNASPPVLNHQFWVWKGASYDAYSDTGPTLGSLPYLQSFWVALLPGGSGAQIDLLIPRDPTTLAQ